MKNYTSLKSFIQERGFTEITPQYQPCVKFIEAISPKNNKNQTDVVDLTSQTEDETIDNNNDIDILLGKIKTRRKNLKLKRKKRNCMRTRGNFLAK